MNSKIALYTIPVPSTDLTSEAFLDCTDGTPTIRYSYVSELGTCDAGIRFLRVSAFRQRGERLCTSWHIESAYDTLVEIVDSSWITDLSRDLPDRYRSEWKTRHFMIYLDSAGCFEFLAEDWKAFG